MREPSQMTLPAQLLFFLVAFSVISLFSLELLQRHNIFGDSIFAGTTVWSSTSLATLASRKAISPHKYERPDKSACDIHRVSLKYTPSCNPDDKLKPRFIKQLLVVAVQRSGTEHRQNLYN